MEVIICMQGNDRSNSNDLTIPRYTVQKLTALLSWNYVLVTHQPVSLSHWKCVWNGYYFCPCLSVMSTWTEIQLLLILHSIDMVNLWTSLNFGTSNIKTDNMPAEANFAGGVKYCSTLLSLCCHLLAKPHNCSKNANILNNWHWS